MQGQGIEAMVVAVYHSKKIKKRESKRKKVARDLRSHFLRAFAGLIQVKVNLTKHNGVDLYCVEARYCPGQPDYVFHVLVNMQGALSVDLYMGPNPPDLD